MVEVVLAEMLWQWGRGSFGSCGDVETVGTSWWLWFDGSGAVLEAVVKS